MKDTLKLGLATLATVAGSYVMHYPPDLSPLAQTANNAVLAGNQITLDQCPFYMGFEIGRGYRTDEYPYMDLRPHDGTDKLQTYRFHGGNIYNSADGTLCALETTPVWTSNPILSDENTVSPSKNVIVLNDSSNNTSVVLTPDSQTGCYTHQEAAAEATITACKTLFGLEVDKTEKQIHTYTGVNTSKHRALSAGSGDQPLPIHLSDILLAATAYATVAVSKKRAQLSALKNKFARGYAKLRNDKRVSVDVKPPSPYGVRPTSQIDPRVQDAILNSTKPVDVPSSD